MKLMQRVILLLALIGAVAGTHASIAEDPIPRVYRNWESVPQGRRIARRQGLFAWRWTASGSGPAPTRAGLLRDRKWKSFGSRMGLAYPAVLAIAGRRGQRRTCGSPP